MNKEEIDELVKSYMDKVPEFVQNNIGVTNMKLYFNEIIRKIAEGCYRQGIEDCLEKQKSKNSK